MSDRIRVGIIGAGANTRLKHIPGSAHAEQRRDGRRSPTAVEEVERARRRRNSTSRRSTPTGPEHRGQDPAIDAVCIGTWPYMHAQMTIAALDAGKHVLCEARMAMNAQEAHAMLAASRRNPSRIAQIVPAPMTLPVDRTVVDLIADGALGDIIAVDLRVSTGRLSEPGDAAALAATTAISPATT